MRSSIRTVSLELSRSSLASFISAAVAASGVAALSSPAAAQPPVERKQIQATRVDRPPVMDGKLDDEVWKQAVPITDFHQTRPGDGTAASEATEVSVVYTEDAIYISARMGDSDPELIAAPTIRHGQGLGPDDRLIVILDPFNTHRTGYRFETNLNAVRHDALYQSVGAFSACSSASRARA